MAGDVIVATLENLPGYRVTRVIGVVSASVVMAKHVGEDLLAALRNLVGGEVAEYTRLMDEARRTALARLMEKARQMGANAVIGLRFSTSTIMSGAAEILVYGTAVVAEKAT